MKKTLPRAEFSEAVGISSRAVQKMLNDMEKNGIDIHSVMILRYGKVACEAWKYPMTPDNPHMVYSISKSFLSVAYGFAVSEGLVNEKTKFLDVFPEYARYKKDINLEKLTLFDLLGMCAGKRTTRLGPNWLDTFVEAVWDFAPGESFRYVNDNYIAASAALTKLTGMSITEYLTPRLYEPLCMDVPFWETTPQGYEVGGWGMLLKTEDIAKFILCCHNNGVFNGKQVIPKEWIEFATSNAHDSSVSQKESDSAAGYGYGFWRCSGMENTFRCEGLYSQYAISFKDYDACLVMTGGCVNLQKTLDIIWRHIKKIFIPINRNIGGSKIRISPFKPYLQQDRSRKENELNGKTFQLRKQRFVDKIGYPVSSIPMPAIGMSKYRGGDISNLSFVFDAEGCTMKWSESEKYFNTQYVSLNGTYSYGIIDLGELHFETATCGRWINENTLEIRIRPLCAIAERKFIFKFKGKRILMYPDMLPGMDERAAVVGEKLKCILKGRYFEWWIDTLVPRVKYLLQPTHHGKMIKNSQ